MKKLFIHIGIHKTATTFLQYEYFPYLEGLSYFQYSVPNIYTNLGTYNLKDNILISNEGLSGVPWNKDWLNGIPNDFHWINSYKTSIKNLKRLHPNATILVMFRKHGDLLVSIYKQYIQEGGILSFESFYGESKLIREIDLNFEERVSFLKEHFDEVVVFSFEDFKKEGSKYLNTFFSQYDLREIKKAESKERNKSISGKNLLRLRNINKYYRHFPLKLRKLLRLLRISPRDLFQTKLSFLNSGELSYLEETRQHINEEFRLDWEYIQENAYKSIKDSV